MSGVAGIYYLDGKPADAAAVERMTESLSHRGRDGAGTWCSGPVGLGHRAHRTTPEAIHADSPMRAGGDRLVVTADLRIDNREELVTELSLADRPLHTISDEELLLEAYQKWGESCPEKLLGDFSFALWDDGGKKLFCARDHLGVKPLYYHASETVFLFASEIKALFCHPGMPRKLNETRVADYLAMNFEDKAGTFYQGINRLPPGCCLTVEPHGVRHRAYWTLDRSMERRMQSSEKYAEAFLDIFDKALRCRLRSADPPGFLLSGGLDSTSIVCRSQQLAPGGEDEKLISLSATFADFPQVDEQPYIDIVLARGGIEASFIRADRIGPLHDIDRVLRHQDEPFHAPNLFVYWVLAEAAHRRGVSVLIDGVDGDTTVSHGLEFLIELARRGRWVRLLSEVAWLSRRFGFPSHRFFWHSVLMPAAVDPLIWKLRSLVGRGGSKNPVPRPATVNPSFARRVGWEDRYRSLMEGRAGPVRSHREEHWRSLSSGLIPFYLEVNDKAAAAFGIDHRHPFYDRRLVEYCLAVPPDQKLNRGWDRVVQRRAMKDVVPEKIRWRIRKSHWAPNFKRGLFEFDRSLVEQVVLDDPGPIAEFVDVPALREAYRCCRSGRISESDGMNIWVAVTLALWLRKMDLSP